MSFAAAASPPATEFDYHGVFAAADAALYEAKRAGRNQVRTDVEESVSPVTA